MAEPNEKTKAALIELDKPLEEMNKTELFAVADELKIPGRYDMNKAQLLAALEEALTNPEPAAEGEDALVDAGEELEGTDGADGDRPTSPSNPPPAEDPIAAAAAAAKERTELEAKLVADAEERERTEQAQAKVDRELAETQARERSDEEKRARETARREAHANNQLHEDDRLTIMRADTAQLESLLLDVNFPAFMGDAVKVELAARKKRAEATEHKRLQRSPNKQFKITSGPAGMRYVTKEAYSTTLPLGSIITPLAYDLQHVADQGFTWEMIAGVELSEDQMGNPVSVAK